MKIGLLVLGSPVGTYSCHSAYETAVEILNQRHTLHRVFFYQDAALIGNNKSEPVNSTDRIQDDWIALAKEHNLDLTVCVSAAQRRGIVESSSESNLVEGFSISGLGQLVEAMLVCDRIVTFP